MKKKIISVFVLVATLVGLFVFSQVTTANTNFGEDIPNNSYVIGTNLFTSDAMLTTEDIMLAAKTIENNSTNDMIIYYKTPRGKWVNGLTGEEITLSSEFYLEYINGVLIKTIQYGDADGDGSVTMRDLIYIRRYLAGWEMPKDMNVRNADVNGDGKVTEADVVLLRKYFANWYKDANLPNEPLGKTYTIGYMVGNDIYQTDYELGGQEIHKPDNPTKTGYNFEDWYLDTEYKNKFNFENSKATENIVLYAKFVKIQYGDVKNDGKINLKDLAYLKRYLGGWKMPEDINIRNADVNADGKINEADVVLLKKYVAGWYEEKNLPNEPLGKSYVIEYIVDDETYKTDYELEGHNIVKIDNPTKDGYNFDGWYLDTEYKNEFDFENTKITENIVLYAKFVKIQYGDVKNDGKINLKDVSRIKRYLAGWEMPEDTNIGNADVNADGKINEADVVLLRKYIAGWYQDKNLPSEPLGKSYAIEYIVDDETYKTDYELENHKIHKPDDPAKDGYNFEGWYLDTEYKTKFDFENSKATENIVLYAKFTDIQYGDVNGDGVVDGKDVTRIRRYLAGWEMPEDTNIRNADVNGDGKVTEADFVLLRKYVGGWYKNTNLPNKPLGKSYIIEYMIGDEVYKTDYQLEDYTFAKPTDPTKEGYTFEGWYLDTDYKTEFDFKNTKASKNIELYAKFTKN